MFQKRLNFYNLKRLVHVNPNIGFNPNTASKVAASEGSSFSSEEQSHFANLAPTWWDPSGNQRILHLMNTKRIEFIKDTLTKNFAKERSNKSKEDEIYIPKFNKDLLPDYIKIQVDNMEGAYLNDLFKNNVKDWKVLDMGCGGGLLTESLSRLDVFKQVKGYDMTEECIQVATKHAKSDLALSKNLEDESLKYEIKDLFMENNVNEKFDMVCCFEMLEHVDEPFKMLNCLKDRLNTGGVLVLSTINKELVSLLTTIVAAEHILNLVPRGTHTFDKYINCSEIENWAFRNKMEVIEANGVMFNPIKDEWELHSKKDIGNFFISLKKL
ncbi:hypothetical protein FOG51_00347 [Hanseniaspora uvarum]|nr:hypothetical protein FOG51_00347 [Hanseniaspora uvarum]